MVRGFWKELKKPIFALAPMADVTDAAFRKIIAKYGKPDVIFTEFVSCDGMCSVGKKNLLIDLKYDESERPIVAQFFGSKPKNFYKCAKMANELGFDGIDINMGCPEKKIIKQKAGVYLVKEPELAKEIIYETKRGAGKLPVSIKTRIGYTKNTISEWLPHLLETKPAAITIHARTKKQMSLVPADWSIIKDAVDIAGRYSSSDEKTIILGNGDIKNLKDAIIKIKETGVDGVMIGRGVLGNPWLFHDKDIFKNNIWENYINKKPSIEDKLKILVEHTFLFEKLFEDKNNKFGLSKNFEIIKKHFKAYISGFDNAKELRIKCMEVKNGGELKNIIDNFLKNKVI